MRKYLSLACGLALTCITIQKANSQLVINGGSITLGDGAFITVQGNFTSNASIAGTGKIIMNGTGDQTLTMSDNANNTIPNLEINKTGGNLVLGGNCRIGNTFNFLAGNFSTNPATSNELIAPLSATFTFSPGTEIIGKVRRDGWVNGSSVIFNSTNMVVNTNGGTPPTSMLVNMVPNGDPTGAEREVKRFFDFAPTGGTGYTADVTFPYKAPELVAGNNTEANIVPWYLASGEWNAKFSGNTPNAANDFVTTTGIDAATFAASEWKLADPRYTFNVNAALRGPWNGTAMSTNLNSNGAIPLAHPYNTTPFNYSGSESVGAIPNSSIVDWVLLELRKPTSGAPADATSSTIIGRKAAFLLNTGNIVDLDGVTPASFNIGKQGAAFVVVRHRNHLGVMSNLKPSNETGSYTNDFTILANSYKNPGASSEPMDLLAGGANKYGLWAGDANKSNSVNSIDLNAIRTAIANLLSGYQFQDVNLNGFVNSLDLNVSKATIAVLGSSSSTSRTSNNSESATIKTHLPD